jgi:hypothetical protein
MPAARRAFFLQHYFRMQIVRKGNREEKQNERAPDRRPFAQRFPLPLRLLRQPAGAPQNHRANGDEQPEQIEEKFHSA